jgi:hypothetical protein
VSSNPDCFQPEEVDFLRRVFDLLCGEATFVRGTMFEELLAASLIHLYQSGTRDEAALLERGRARIANFSSQPHPITAPLQEASLTVADFLAVRPREVAVKRKVDREKLERADREARLVIEAERESRDAKTARLRQERMAKNDGENSR